MGKDRFNPSTEEMGESPSLSKKSLNFNNWTEDWEEVPLSFLKTTDTIILLN
jgi:hypothetical protein